METDISGYESLNERRSRLLARRMSRQFPRRSFGLWGQLMAHSICFAVALTIAVASGGRTLQCISLAAVTAQCFIFGLGASHRSENQTAPLARIWIFFFGLFYICRAWRFVIVGDTQLMDGLGVPNIDFYSTLALCCLSGFILFTAAGYQWGFMRAEQSTISWRLLTYIHRSNRRPGESLGGAIAVVSGLISVGLMYILGQKVEQMSADAPWINYLLAFPYVIFGIILCTWTDQWEAAINWRSFTSFLILGFLVAAVSAITLLTRDVAAQRTYYLAPLALIAFASIARMARIVRICMLFSFLLPVVTALGNTRELEKAESVHEAMNIVEINGNSGAFELFTAPFAAASGDFTCFDVLMSVLAHKQEFRPWGLSLLYVFVHPIPRAWWPGKPEEGFLSDRSYLALTVFGQNTVMIPYTPGIVGELYLEGWFGYLALGGLLFGWFLSEIEKFGFAMRTRNEWADYRVYYAFWFFLLFMSVRSVPYQLLFWGFFMGIGMVFYNKVIRTLSRIM